MGSKCFRPVNESNQPVYISSLNHALVQAEKIYKQKYQSKQDILQQIVKNQNRKGNLKKLFDHLASHQKNVLPSIKYCNKRASQQKSFSIVVICDMFCDKLVKLIQNKKINYFISKKEQNANNKTILSTKSLLNLQHDMKNLFHDLESHFFQLVLKTLVYNKDKQIQNSISQTLIQYSSTCQQKLSSKKQLKDVLDLYLNYIFQKNIQLINKKSYLPFYAYSSLLSKSRNQLFTADFIQKHFNFILKLFFQLQDCKKSNKSLTQTYDFSLFEQSVENIVKQFLLFSSENKKIKGHIFNQIMCQEDLEKFDPLKTQKLQKIIQQNFNSYNREHFMFDWLGYLINYIGKSINDHESVRTDSIRQSIQQIQNSNHCLIPSLKNSTSSQSRLNCMDTLKRWFVQNLLNIDKTLEYFSERIFEVLLVNLYNPNGNNEEINQKSQQVLIYFLEIKPKKLSQILCLLNKQLRKGKNQFYFPSVNILNSNINTSSKRRLTIIQEQAAQNLWQNDLSFILKQSKVNQLCFQLTQQQIEQIYAPLSKHSKLSINLIYLAQLGGVGLNYINLQMQNVQKRIYNYLISLQNCMKIQDEQIQKEYEQKLIKKLKFLFSQLEKHNQILLYSFLKHCLKYLNKEDNQFKGGTTSKIWIQILIMIIVIHIVLQENCRKKHQKRIAQLNQFLNKILDLIDQTNLNSFNINQCYQTNFKLLHSLQKFSDRQLNKQLKNFQTFQKTLSIKGIPKSATNIEDSVVSSKLQVSQSNPDYQFKNIIQIVLAP